MNLRNLPAAAYAAIFFTLAFASHCHNSAEPARRDAEDAVVALFIAVDQRDWPQVRRTLAPRTTLDYVSLAGGEPSVLSPEQIANNWSAFLPGFDATHHQLGNFQFKAASEKRVEVRFYGTATHYIANAPGGELWTVVGDYEVELDRIDEVWRISRIKFNLKYIHGNRDLPALAQKRAASAR